MRSPLRRALSNGLATSSLAPLLRSLRLAGPNLIHGIRPVLTPRVRIHEILPKGALRPLTEFHECGHGQLLVKINPAVLAGPHYSIIFNPLSING